MDAIRREWRAQWRNLLPQLMMVVAGFVLGRLIALVVELVSHEKEWVPLGALLAAFGLLAIFFTVAMQFVMGLNHAILMSRTRIGFMIGNYLMGMLVLLLGLLLMIALGWMEYVTASTADAQLLGIFRKIAAVLLHPLFLIGFPVCGVIFADFIGALLARYGKRAGWTLWAIWMLGSLVLPRMAEASSGKDTLLTRAGQALGKLLSQLTPTALVITGVLCTVAALAGTVAMTRKKKAEA